MEKRQLSWHWGDVIGAAGSAVIGAGTSEDNNAVVWRQGRQRGRNTLIGGDHAKGRSLIVKAREDGADQAE